MYNDPKMFYQLMWNLVSIFKIHRENFFAVWVFFDEHWRITGLQGKGEGISLTPHYHFRSLHRHLDISRVITTGSSPLHIASRRSQTGNFWFPRASHESLSCAPSKIMSKIYEKIMNIFVLSSALIIIINLVLNYA